MMKNETFVNGINFIRSVMARTRSLDGLGAMGSQMVLENVVDAGLNVLRREAALTEVKGIELNVFSDMLDDESFVVPPMVAQEVIKRVRMTNCLIDERDEFPKVKSIRIDNQMATVDVDTGELLANGAPDEENRLAEMIIDLYDYWIDVELGGVGHSLYLLLLMGNDAVGTLLERLKDREFLNGEEADMMNEAFRLKDDLSERIHLLLEYHPDYGRTFGCNGDCANCEHFEMECDGEE